MANSKSWLNYVYLVYFLIHIPVMLCVDLVPLYPHSLWVPTSAPLHFLYELREYYIRTYNDQFFAPPPAPIPSFFPFFALLELGLHLPVSVWAVGALWPKKGGAGGLSGAAELLMLVYGLETVLTTATCMYEVWLWDPVVVTSEQKTVLLGGLYGGYLAVAMILSTDMYMRILKRVDPVDPVKKGQ